MGMITTLVENELVCKGCRQPYSEFLRPNEQPEGMCSDCVDDIDVMIEAEYEEALGNGESWAEEAYAFNHPEGDG